MTQNYFNQVKANFSEFEGQEVEFTYYIPSADKYATAKGILKAIGTGCNEDSLIISSRGKDFAIYFKQVTMLNALNRQEFIATMEAYIEKLNNERKEIKATTDKHDMNAYHMISKIGHEISAIENAIRELNRQ